MPSTVIKNFRYDQDSQILRVEFLSGKMYAYKKVPEEIYLGLKGSREKGVYFNVEIRGRFEFERTDHTN